MIMSSSFVSSPMDCHGRIQRFRFVLAELIRTKMWICLILVDHGRIISVTVN